MRESEIKHHLKSAGNLNLLKSLKFFLPELIFPQLIFEHGIQTANKESVIKPQNQRIFFIPSEI